MIGLDLGRPSGPAPCFLFLGAHCDDIEIGCGGTVLRLVREHPDATFHWVVFASNPRRRDEARRCAAAFLEGARETNVEIRDFRESYFPWVGAEIKDHFEAVRRRCEPDLVFTHYRHDRHQDHRTISDLTWNTFRDHLILEYEIPKYDGDLGRPNTYFPLDRPTLDRKVESLLACYESQRSRPWFSADTFEALARLRGIEANAPEGLAEAFHSRKVIL